MKKFLCMILCVAFLTGVMPFCTFAAEQTDAVNAAGLTTPPDGKDGNPVEITEIRINGYQTAVIGKTPDGTPAVTVPDDAPYTIDGIYWWNDSSGEWLDSSDKFEAGKYYSCQFYVKPNGGYVFAGSPTIYINGGTELVDLSYCQPLSSGKYEVWSVSEEAVAGGIETVSVIDILDFVKPTPGTKCSEAPIPTVADDAPYYIGEYYWYCDSDSAGLSSDGVFDAEKSYSLYMELNAKENGEFSDTAYAQINGTRDLVDSRYGGYRSKSLFTVWTVTFRPGEDAAEEITEIRINGYQKAVIGKTPDEMPAVTVPDDAPYTIYGIYWWNDTANSWLSGSDVFETGNYYSCQFYVNPNGGCVFTTAPTIYINGGTALVDPAYSGLMSSGKYEVWSVSEEAVSGGPSAITEIRIDGYQKAVIGKTPDEMPAVTVPDDAPYTIDGIYWWNDTANSWLSGSVVFETGNYYSCQFFVKPNDGYVFAGSPTIYLNGGTALVDLAYGGLMSSGKYEVWSVSEEAVSGGPSAITEIRITGYQTAVIGKTPADIPAAAVPNDAPYTIYGTYWWNDTKGIWMGSSDKFEAGNIYSCQYYVKPNDGYVFASNPTIYINGGTDLVDLSYCQLLTDGKYEVWSVMEAPVSGGSGEIMYGDVNGDGKINGQDLIRLRKYLNGEDVVIFDGADVTGNGAVNGQDLVRLRKHLNGESVVLGPGA